MSRRRSSHQSTLSRIYDIGGADLALRYHEISERKRAEADAQSPAAQRWAAFRPRRAVYINGVRLDDERVAALEGAWHTTIADGRYWYDPASGAWGVEGGPSAGFIQPGLQLGGPLRADASGGGSSVYLNGREVHPQELGILASAIPLWPGHYWLDGYGRIGRIGGVAIANLATYLGMPAAAAQQW